MSLNPHRKHVSNLTKRNTDSHNLN